MQTMRLVLLSMCGAVALAVGCVQTPGDSGGDYEDGYGGSDPEPPDDEEPLVDVTGEWATQWGSTYADMTLSQSGNYVDGSYSLSTSYGSISGTLTGYTLNGTWSDQYGEGSFSFVFASDGNSFDGTWGDNASWDGSRK
jgi:hypothetical protein